MRITPNMNRGGVEDLDGLVIGGGADVDLGRFSTSEMADYLQEDFERTRLNFREKLRFLLSLVLLPLILLVRFGFSRKGGFGTDVARDDLEFTLLAQAVRRSMPVMGICRGMQLINTYFGGTLHADIEEFYEGEPVVNSIFPAKIVALAHDSRLAIILNRHRERVNALHHQAVDKLGTNLRAVAHEHPHGIVQAFESNNGYSFMLGVQWHPEYLPQKRSQVRLFEALVKAAQYQAPVG